MALIQIEENDLRQKALQIFKEEAERFERETGKSAKDLREDPNWKSWMGFLGSSAAPGSASAPHAKTPEQPDFGGKTPGEIFCESEAFKAFKEDTVAKHSKPVRTANFDPRFRSGRSRIVNPYKSEHMKSVLGGHYKTEGVGGSTDARSVLALQLLQEIIELPHRPESVADLFTHYPTSVGAIHYIRQTGFTNNAGMAPENTDPATAVARPQSQISFTAESTTIRTISHWIPVPNQMLDDIVQLAPFIDNQLILMMRDVKSVDLLYGDGTGNNIAGLLTDGAIQTRNWSAGFFDSTTGGPRTDNQADAILRGITQLQVAWYEPDGVVMSKTTGQNIALLKDAFGRYLFPNFLDDRKLWGLPCVLTTAIQDADVAIGAYKKAAAIWDREEPTVRISDSHANFFVEGMKAVLAEERLALTDFRPESFLKLNLDHAPTS